MADILSQDEIDRLLNVAASEPAPETADMRPSEVEAAERFTKAFFASANSAVATLLAQPATVTEGLGQVVSVSDLDTTSALLGRFPFRSGFTGEMVFLLRLRDASVLADLILGGQGTAKDALDDADRDAIKEALSQVAGSGVATLSVALGREVGFASPQIQEAAQGQLAEALHWGTAFVGIGSLRVEGVLETPFRLLLPVGVAKEMARLAEEGEQEEIAPAREQPPPAPVQAPLEPFRARPTPPADLRNIDLILDIEVEVMVRLGGAQMPLKEIQKLRPGSIIDLDKDTDSPLELVVNDRVIAKGELVVVGSDHFALRIIEIESPTERIRKLGA